MRSSIQNYCYILLPLNWTPTIEELMKNERMPPLSVILFLKKLLKHSKHRLLAKKMRLIEIYASDFIRGVRNDKVLTPKHFLLGLGLHSITGQRKTCTNCQLFEDTVWLMITPWRLKPHKPKISQLFGFWWISFLLLQLATEDHSVLTIFWADNFDNVFLLVLPQKYISKKFHFICYWLRFIICFWKCACVTGGGWVSLGEGEYDYKQFSSINLMNVLCTIFTNVVLKISLMDYIVLAKLPWCSTQQANSKTPIIQIC